MLEAMRRNSRGTIVYVLFGIIIAVFIINFGPGQRGCGAGLTNSYAARIAGVAVSEQEYRLYYVAVRGPSYPIQIAKQYRVKESVMDKIIERELLAQEAERLGFSVSDKEAEDFVAQGKMLVLGVRRRFDDVVGGNFDYKRFRNFCEQLGVTVNKFIDVERREMLAEKAKNLMLGTVKVTPAEVQDAYTQRETQTNLEFVRFQARQFEANVEVSADEIAAYAKTHDKELRDLYKEREFLYKKLDKQVRTRRILVSVNKEESDAGVIETAKKKADKAKKRVTDPGAPEDFAKLAKEISDDASSKNKGGDMGWHKKDYTGLGTELETLIFAAKAGDVIGPVRGDKGFEVIKVEGFREGDLSFESVAGELAEEKLRTDKSKAKAKEAADDAAAQVKAGQDLAALYPKPAEGDDAAAVKNANTPPHVEESGLFARKGELVPQIGVSPEIMKKAFEMKANEVAGPFEVASAFVVVRAKELKQPDKAFFDKHQDDEIRQMERQKWSDVLDGWTRQRCTEVDGARRISVNHEVLAYEGAAGADTAYTPCGSAKK